MGALQAALEHQIKELPKIKLREILQKKIDKSGEKISDEALTALIEHIMSGNSDTFSWNDGRPSTEIKLILTEVDTYNIIQSLEDFLNTGLQDLIENFSSSAAEDITKELHQRWLEQHTQETIDVYAFQRRLALRWGVPLNIMKMLLTAAREIGSNNAEKISRSRSKKNVNKNYLLIKLHCRACQISSEIITLIEAGFADGAMARWRSLHETTVIALLIADYGESLATRYVAYEIVEIKRGSDEYNRTQVPLGFRPHSKKELRLMHQEYDSVVRKFGLDFTKPYGWAASTLGKKSVNFADLERAAGRSEGRSYYKLASYNIHSSPRSLKWCLGSLQNTDVFLAGASNAGFEEPGQHTVLDLARITSIYYQQKFSIDDIIELKVLNKLCNQAIFEFVKCAKKLAKEQTALSA